MKLVSWTLLPAATQPGVNALRQKLLLLLAPCVIIIVALVSVRPDDGQFAPGGGMGNSVNQLEMASADRERCRFLRLLTVGIGGC